MWCTTACWISIAFFWTPCIIAKRKATAWFNVKLPSFMIFVTVFTCFLVYFSLFWIKYPPIGKIRVQNTVVNYCLLYVMLCLNAPRKPHAHFTTWLVNYPTLIRLTTFRGTQLRWLPTVDTRSENDNSKSGNTRVARVGNLWGSVKKFETSRMFSNFMSKKKTQVFKFNCKFLKFKLYVCCFPVSTLSFSVFLYVFTFNIVLIMFF